MKYKILLVIFAVCLAASAILAFIPTEKICGDEGSSCSIVQNSQYKETLGVNNSYFGLIAFTILIFLTISHMRKPRRQKKLLLVLGVTASALASLYFIYLQAFVIKAFCLYCMVVDAGSLIAFIVIIVMGKTIEVESL